MIYFKDTNDGWYQLGDGVIAKPEWIQVTKAEYDVANTHIPTQAEQFKSIERAFDRHIDNVADARGYGRDGFSLVSPSEACLGYAAYPNQWQAEAVKFGQWVADCCARMIQGQADVIAGTRPMPTPEQAIAELQVMVW